MIKLDGISTASFELKIKEMVGTLLFAEFPSTVVFVDDDGTPIIKEWVDCSDEGDIDRYFFYKTSRELLKKFIDGELSHQDLINKAIAGLLYFQDYQKSEVILNSIIPCDYLPNQYKPSSDFFFDESDGVDAKLIYDFFNQDDNSMITRKEDIIKIFDSLDTKNFSEDDIHLVLSKLRQEDKSLVDDALKAEIMAFGFLEDYRNQDTNSGTYFGPIIALPNEDGTYSEYPSIRSITSNMIDYWEKRAKNSTNPILKARYSGLVWDFKKKITGKDVDHNICLFYIKALINIANGDFHKIQTNTFIKLNRALTLSLSISDKESIEQVKNALISFEQRHSINNKYVSWCYSFDLLIGNRKIILSETEENLIIKGLEETLIKLTTTSDGEEQKIDPWTAQEVAKRLATYYRKKQKNEEAKRVILEVGNAYDKIIEDATAMQVSSWLDDLYKLYLSFNLKDEAEKVLLRIRELEQKLSSELKSFSVTYKLNIEEYIATMNTYSPEETIRFITIDYIPIKEKVIEHILKSSQEESLIYLSSQKILDEEGRLLTTIGTLKDDLEGHIVKQTSQNFSLLEFYLDAVLNESIKNKLLSKEGILAFLNKVSFIDLDRISIVEIALDAYFQKNYLVFIHLIIPQIEGVVRKILEMVGGNVLKPSKSGGHHLRTFDEILRDEILKKAIGEDLADYFRILFTDQRGWNLRNKVCHGIMKPSMFDIHTANRVLHALFCFGLITIEDL